MCTQKMRALSYIGAEKITFPPDIHTDIHTFRRTDISVYRVASLLKKEFVAMHTPIVFLLWLSFQFKLHIT